MYTAEQYRAIRDREIAAILLATHAHEGQVDKGGEPYILHPLRVGSYFTSGDWEPRVVGYLHDVVEDTDVTLAFLREVFPPTIVAAVDAISRRKGERDLAYLDRIMGNHLATRVKYADANDNSDPARLAKIVDLDTCARLQEKYTAIRSILNRVL